MEVPEVSGLRREAAEEVRVTVIGCGFAGLCMTIKLMKVSLPTNTKKTVTWYLGLSSMPTGKAWPCDDG
jgi:cation diffusion facilitator CzcD-associated flavoprotein CzcO